MASITYRQAFNGYWRDKKRGGIPEVSGVYCVYAGTYNSNSKTVTLKRLLYIGQSVNIHDRLQNHECEDDWKKQLKAGEEVMFSYTELPCYSLDRFEAAMIYKHKPPVNKEYVDNFPFDTTTVYTSKDNALLCSEFTVYRTVSESKAYYGW